MDIIEALASIGGSLKILLGVSALPKRQTAVNVPARETRSKTKKWVQPHTAVRYETDSLDETDRMIIEMADLWNESTRMPDNFDDLQSMISAYQIEHYHHLGRIAPSRKDQTIP